MGIARVTAGLARPARGLVAPRLAGSTGRLVAPRSARVARLPTRGLIAPCLARRAGELATRGSTGSARQLRAVSTARVVGGVADIDASPAATKRDLHRVSANAGDVRTAVDEEGGARTFG